MSIPAPPLVTVVIPVFNGERFLHDAIDSAVAQDYPSLEVIVVDDGSTDRSEQIARSYGKRIRYMRKPNGGVSSALNLAISEMRGEFLSWLSHDDAYRSTKLSHQVGLWKQRSRVHGTNLAVYSDVRYMDEAGRIFRRTAFPGHREPLGIIPVMLGRINGCSLLIPHHVLRHVGDFNESLKSVQDYDYWFRMSIAGCRFAFTSRADTLSRLHAEQGSVRATAMAEEASAFFISLLERLSEEHRSELRSRLPLHATLLRIKSEDNGYHALTQHLVAAAPAGLAYRYYKYLDRSWDGRLSLLGVLLHPLQAIRLIARKGWCRIARQRCGYRSSSAEVH